MIRHIVEFKLAATDPAQRATDADGIRQHLTSLQGVVTGLRSITVLPDLGRVEGHWDLVLVSEHDSAEALEGYQAHPAHREASAWVAARVSDRAVIDYELPA
ncbi:MAG TPA: Dabb family protein [Pseudolysinimonas sp.]|jgi:hypothetical protein|nr:Dabb family protein [Pseudolysinimonas sp.]